MRVVTARSARHITSPPLAIAGAVVMGTEIGYVRLLSEQGSFPSIDARVAWVLIVLLGMAVLAGIGAVARSPAVRAALAAACAAVLLPLGVLAAFSIGLPLLAAGTIAVAVWGGALRETSDRSAFPSITAGIAAFVALALGLVATG